MKINFSNAVASVAKKAAAVGLSVLLAAPVVSADDFDDDFGLQVERELHKRSEKLFGIEKPLGDSAPPTVGP